MRERERVGGENEGKIASKDAGILHITAFWGGMKRKWLEIVRDGADEEERNFESCYYYVDDSTNDHIFHH